MSKNWQRAPTQNSFQFENVEDFSAQLNDHVLSLLSLSLSLSLSLFLLIQVFPVSSEGLCTNLFE